MGMVSNTFIMMLFLSYALGVVTDGSTLFTDMVNHESGLHTKFIALLGLASLATVVAGIYSQTVSFALFSGIVTFLLGFFTFPINIFTAAGFPMEVKLLLGTAFGFTYLFGLLNFYKGTGEA